MGVRRARPCTRCATALAADNQGRHCGPCAKKEVQDRASAPLLDENFWHSAAIQAAFAQQHIGRIFKAYRENHSPTLTQSVIGDWLGLSQGQVSRIESTARPVGEIRKLAQWANALRIPKDHLWFTYPRGEYEHNNLGEKIEEAPSGPSEPTHARQLLQTIGLSTAGTRANAIVPTTRTTRRTIGAPDVEIMIEMTRTFRRLDNKFGGGRGRTVVASYISNEVRPALAHGQFDGAVKKRLFTAAADLHQLAGWMAYHTGNAMEGKRHLREGVRICQEIRNGALAAEMLAGMGHHAAFNG